MKTNNNYFPYKIFQKNNHINHNINRKNNNLNFFPTKKKNSIIDISKNLKSVAVSNKLFSNYMEKYNNLTQDYCFKSPGNDNYPIRKNARYLSSGIKSANALYLNRNNRLIVKRPLTNISRLKQISVERNNLFHIVNKSDINRNPNNDLLLSISEGLSSNDKSMSRLSNNNIDLDNDKNTKSENFEYLKNYINNINDLNEYFDKEKLSHSNVLSKGNVQYKLIIYSLCLKFRNIRNDNKSVKQKYQKLYLNFKYLPILYLVNYEIFKTFLSDIIYYDYTSNAFAINKNFDSICEKYYNYINKNINSENTNINDIIFYKNEFCFPSFYKWFVYNKCNDNDNDKNNNDNKGKSSINALIFDLKIEFPKIKFKIINYGITIKNNLKKSLVIQLMKAKFYKWEEIILYDLFFIKKFRYIINSILIGHKKYYKQKISLLQNYSGENNKISINLNHNFEFYITEINENFSTFFIFSPYIITLSRQKINYNQEINLTLKESKSLYKFSKYWGFMNTLLKCINYNSEVNKNKITFNFDLLDNIPLSYFKENEIKIKEKKDQMKFKFNKIDIMVSDCTLKKFIIINEGKSLEKLYKVPPKFLNIILQNKEKYLLEENKIIEYCKEIKEEKEIENKREFNTRKNNDLYEDDLIMERHSSRTNNSRISIRNVKLNEKKKMIVDNNKQVTKAKNNSKSQIINQKKNFNIKKSKFFVNNSKNLSDLSQSQFIFRSSTKNKSLQLIRNKRELEKSRTMRDNNFLLNNKININELKKTISLLQQKEDSLKKK